MVLYNFNRKDLKKVQEEADLLKSYTINNPVGSAHLSSQTFALTHDAVLCIVIVLP